MALNDFGISSPQPIAWQEKWSGGWLVESHYLCAFQEFEHDASALQDADCEDRDEKLEMLGQAVGRMHEAGLLHLDINQGNWLFSRSGEGRWELDLIDNNRLRRRTVSLGRGVKCLLQLEFEGEVQTRLLHAYADSRGFEREACVRTFDTSKGRYELKWRVKNATRPWRKKIGL
ncbi:lipopolysaccharide kinase InaA family protein [Pelagicoccus mobilis]|uniref:Lipopolysaccharide kinase (Kdo/WaaP) family protein n=1 Tax=Pelagicoccus mobilis TaxID=415221 RepID=A0A934S0Z0_9BACT|nr:lipopolysaccharide kinase InaA family protein [Pelagicoccus mobilis]MBK1879913.1 hypothetical protein [Pelagicoccus mobilis]